MKYSHSFAHDQLVPRVVSDEASVFWLFSELAGVANLKSREQGCVTCVKATSTRHEDAGSPDEALFHVGRLLAVDSAVALFVGIYLASVSWTWS